jgi:hypothetical protein
MSGVTTILFLSVSESRFQRSFVGNQIPGAMRQAANDL